MKSHEVLKRAMARVGVKAVAAEMGLSPSLVYKWCEGQRDDERPDQSGAVNPLDRVREIQRITGDAEMIGWLCGQAGGFFVENPKPIRPEKVGTTVLDNTRALLREFSGLLDEVSRAIGDGTGVSGDEASRIRREWEQLKTRAEGFVRGCEQGTFRNA